MEIDNDAMIISNEGRVARKEKSGKKKRKEEENKDAMILDIDTRHMENQQKKKRKKEKKAGRELDMRNKEKKDLIMIFDKEKQLENKEEEQNAVVDGNDEMDANEAANQDKNKEKKNKKKTKDIAADSSKHVKHNSKKVRFSDGVKVFSSTNSSTNSIKKADGLVRGKRFSREEDEIIKKAVFEYIEANDLGEEGLYMVLHCKKYPKILHCWHEIRTALPWRPFLSVYLRAHTLFERGSRKWTPEELELVRKSYEKHGANWTLIAREMGKFRQHVKDAWRRIKLIDVKRGHWSQEEYQNLFELVNKDLQMKALEEKKSVYRILRDNISWEAISTKLGTRSNANCCQKWYHQLTSPMVSEGKWADVDDYRLLMVLVDLDASCEDEVDWENLLENRSGDLCRARWQQMVRNLGEHGNKSFSEQVEVLSKRYCPDLVEVREKVGNRPIVD